jgi:hypothetical protein
MCCLAYLHLNTHGALSCVAGPLGPLGAYVAYLPSNLCRGPVPLALPPGAGMQQQRHHSMHLPVGRLSSAPMPHVLSSGSLSNFTAGTHHTGALPVAGAAAALH